MVGLVVTIGQQEKVVHLWLRRSRHGNALDPKTVVRLHGELSDAESNPECLAVVIRAEGSNFCAGADVKAGMELMHNPEQLLSFFADGRRLMERLVKSRLVSIAVVQGLAAAGGLELATAVDIVIATDTALFADRHATYGFLPAFGATALLPIRVGNNVARNLLLGKQELNVSTAKSVGLVHRCCSPDEVDQVVEQEISRLKSIGSDALSSMKNLINVLAPVSFEKEALAVRQFCEAGGYEPSQFTERGELGQDSGR